MRRLCREVHIAERRTSGSDRVHHFNGAVVRFATVVGLLWNSDMCRPCKRLIFLMVATVSSTATRRPDI